MSTRTAILVAASSAVSICMAQSGPETSVDRVSNWPAPLYWQAYPASPAPASHHGRSREQAGMKAVPATPATPSVFVAISPCRVMDTRYTTAPPSGPFGAPAFVATEIRTIAIPSGPCPVPSNAVAYSLNIAVVPNPPGSPVRWLTAWDSGNTQPNAATLNDKAGLITSNSAVVPAGSGGAIDIFVTDPTNVIIDINGYYAPPSTLPLTGTAAAPALTFGDTSTGLYSDAAGTVSISTGGVGRLGVRGDGDIEMPGNIRKNGTLFLHASETMQDTAVGTRALLGETASSGANTAMGHEALEGNTGGGGNAAFGTRALAANSTGSFNSALGAWSLTQNATGSNETAIGAYALGLNDTGNGNTAVGAMTLADNTAGDNNVAVGNFALTNNTTGKENIGVGLGALQSNFIGNDNIGLGTLALSSLGMAGSTSTLNTAIGAFAGVNLVYGHYNIYIANQGGAAGESNTIRIGDSNQNRTFVAGVTGVITGNANPIPVVVDSAGQLGTVSSSRNVKRDIEAMGDTTATILSLRPVAFRYRAYGPDSPLQYGLIAEEVAEVAPDLVARDKDGQIETVYYDKVNAMLLNEVQKLHRLNQKLEARLAELENRTK